MFLFVDPSKWSAEKRVICSSDINKENIFIKQLT